MSKNKHAFPWGIYIGDLIDEDKTLSIFLPSETGGFCVLFDDDSEAVANNFIENVILKLFEVLPINELCVDIFDFSHRKRFMHLSSLQADKLYDIALGENEATSKFNELERIALHRHHNLLSLKAPTLSQYNQTRSIVEKYHIVLINLDHYPDDLASYKRIKEFFDSAYDAGFYCIVFGNKELITSEAKATQYLLNRFPTCDIQNKKVVLNNALCEFSEHINGYNFDYVNDNKDDIIETLLNTLHQDDESSSDDKEFLSIPIGTSADEQHDINFTLGDKTKSYHAFITGIPGSGKTTLLNTIILGIAQKYTSEEVRLYLMDYKEGVEFQVFKNHPNCEKIFLDNEDFNASVTLLETFTDTIKKRAEIFKVKEIKDITEYNNLNPQAPMERLILIIDEVHRLFSGSYNQKDHFIDLLKQLVRQGRAFGVHIILSTQTLAGTPIDREIMSQITLRISYKLTDSRDAEAIFTDYNTDALNLNNYELIYNNDSGQKPANQLCRASPPQNIKQEIKKILSSRDLSLVLTPIIFTSKIAEKEIISVEYCSHEISENEGIASKYGVEDDRELLDKLKKEGKIK